MEQSCGNSRKGSRTSSLVLDTCPPPSSTTSQISKVVCGRFPQNFFCGCTIPCKIALKEVQMKLIIPGLYLGPVQAAFKIEDLRRANVTHVLDLSNESYTKHEGLQYLSIQVEDSESTDLAYYFGQTNKFIEGAMMMKGGGAVLVHCQAGISRSPTIVAAYLMWKLSLSADEALDQIRRAVGQQDRCKPNPAFLRQLHFYCPH